MQNMAATPIEITVDRKVYKLAPLTLSQYAYIEKWAKAAPFRDLHDQLEALGDTVSEEIKAKLTEQARAESKTPAAIAGAMNGLAGLQLAFKLCLQSGQAGITDAEIDSVLSVQGLQELERVVSELTESGIGKKKADPQGGAAPVAPSPKTGR